MASYRIVAARPKNASNYLNSEFEVFALRETKKKSVGWKSIGDAASLIVPRPT